MSTEFDYIIIGAGSAGCLLANRLSTDPGKTVLLVEAGGPDRFNPLIHIPAGYAKLHRTAVDWQYETEPQQHLDGRKLYLPRGKVLGGSSSTNAMVYVRGNHADYDDWAALGNRNWSAAECLPYFKRHEANQDLDNEYHGTEGELNVEFAKRHRTPFALAFEKACTQAGFAEYRDYNGAQQAGAGPFQMTIKNGRRHSSARAFLLPILKRKNLTVLTRTHTARILLERDRATGIETARGQRFRARREVVLCAGGFNSPQLLMLSGVGAREELDKHGIECKHDLPGVGKNLQDHLMYGVTTLSKERGGNNRFVTPLGQLRATLDWFVRGRGVYNLGPLESVAFGSSSLSPDRVDFQFQFTPTQVGGDYTVDVYDLGTYPSDQDGYTILPTLLRPESRGYVGLRSADPTAAPVIQPNFLEAENDRQVLIEAGRRAVEVMQAKAFDRYRDRLIYPPAINSDEAWLAHIKRNVETVYHPVGTCKMGNDELAVVNDRLQVHGIESLRVVDASVMPRIVSGNTNAPVYMIAERASEWIH